MTNVRQNFHNECEDAINRHINVELHANYVYLSLAYHFDRDDVALKGFFDFFKKASAKERERAGKLMKYLNKRGGRIVLTDIVKPPDVGKGAADAASAALQLEKDVYASLLHLRNVADAYDDANLCHFLDTEYLQEQVDVIKTLGDFLKNAYRVGEGLGVFLLDKQLNQMSI